MLVWWRESVSRDMNDKLWPDMETCTRRGRWWRLWMRFLMQLGIETGQSKMSGEVQRIVGGLMALYLKLVHSPRGVL